MSKEETIARYIDEFLKGRSPKMVEKFRAKDVDKQYFSIMQWKRKQRLESIPPQDIDIIINNIKATKSSILNAKELTNEEVKKINILLEDIQKCLNEYISQQRVRKIQELEQKQSEIARQLQELRGEEPNLFNMI